MNTESKTIKFSELPTKKKHAWLYMVLLIALGFLTFPIPLTDLVMNSLISRVCFGAAAMIALFALGNKNPNEVE